MNELHESTFARHFSGEIAFSKSHAYRVMTWDGCIAEGFAWTDPKDTRAPESVLRDEGIWFTDRMADPEQRLQVEDLLALIDD